MGFGITIKNLFSKLIKSFREFLKVIFSRSTELILAQLKDIAIKAVLKVQADPKVLTDEAKRKAAFKEIKKEAIERSLIVRDHLINVAIELAVAYIKKQMGGV